MGEGASGREAKVWTVGLVLVLVWLSWALSLNLTRPWTGHHDWNGVLWAQSAHNNLRAGLGTTLGVPTSYYPGALPIPPTGYYVNHPPALPLAVTGTFAVFGECEWAARLVPISCSLVSIVLLWLLVRSCLGERAATLSAAVLTLLPMELYFGRMVNHEPVALMWMLGALLSFRRWELEGRRVWAGAALTCVLAGMWTAWSGYIFAGVTGGLLLLGGRSSQRKLGAVLLGLAVVSAALFLIHVRSVRADAWEALWGAFVFRAAGDEQYAFTWAQWLGRQYHFLSTRIPLLAWGLGAIGAGYTWSRLRSDAGLRWLGWAAASLFLTAASFLVVFSNGSYIHDYWGFYLLAPVAMMAGLALDASLGGEGAGGRLRKVAGVCVACVALVLLAGRGYVGMQRLHGWAWRVLPEEAAEPRDLLPELGRTIYWNFPDETRVLCNLPRVAPHLGHWAPHLEYYARRPIVYDRFTYAEWAAELARLGRRAGGLVWLGAPGAEELWASLPGERKKVIQFDGSRFGLWRPANLREKPAVAQEG